MEAIPFLTPAVVREIQGLLGTPVFVYDQQTLEARAEEMLAFPNRYGLTVRYAMKALPTAAILRLFHDSGIHIDAGSGYEAHRALRAGIPAENIMLTSQELAPDFSDLVEQGVLFNACSLRQLEAYGERFPGRDVAVRINPGLGSGHSNRTNVGGPSSSFGIWYEHLAEVLDIASNRNLRITTMHTHIGSGSDPEVWHRCAGMALGIVAKLPEVTRLSLGGGFKVGRMPDEPSADIDAIGKRVQADFEAFANETGRKLHLEVEPGSYLVVQAGALIASVDDVVDTGPNGYAFIKANCGMTEILRPSLYGAQHPIALVPKQDGADRPMREYIVSGHCCESGDILTPEPGNPEALLPRQLPAAYPGDCLVIGGAGAYCASMSAKNYNSFPEAPEALIQRDGVIELIRQRQSLDQILANETSGVVLQGS